MNSTERFGPAVSTVYQTLLEPSFSGRPMTPTLTAWVPSGSARCHLIPVWVQRRTSAAPSRRKRLSNPVGVADSHTINGSLIGPIMSHPQMRSESVHLPPCPHAPQLADPGGESFLPILVMR